MRKLIILIQAVLIALNMFSQKNIVERLFQKLDNTSYLFIDNSNMNWYTLELKTDTFYNIKDNIFFVDNKPMQIISTSFDNGKSSGVMGAQRAEEYTLKGYKKWELERQKKVIGKSLKNKEELLYSKTGKPILIWWFENPRGKDIKKTQVQTVLDLDRFKSNGITPQCLYHLYLDFIIEGTTNVSICTVIFENEKLEDEINKLKDVANSLNVYGGKIDLITLFRRLENPNYIFKDSSIGVEVEIPSCLNVCKSPYENTLSITFPEKDNIVNAALILWEQKTDSVTFVDFMNRYLKNDVNEDSFKIIKKEQNELRYFLTRRDDWFYVQNVLIEGEKMFYFINFTATKTTYDFNLERFYELIDGIHIK